MTDPHKQHSDHYFYISIHSKSKSQQFFFIQIDIPNFISNFITFGELYISHDPFYFMECFSIPWNFMEPFYFMELNVCMYSML